MSKIVTFRDLIVWQKADELVFEIYKETDKFPRQEKFGLTDQMRRASGSVSFNIAEGYGRRNLPESFRFYRYAAASLEEVKAQTFAASRQRYLTAANYEQLVGLEEEVSKLLTAWMKSTKKYIEINSNQKTQ